MKRSVLRVLSCLVLAAAGCDDETPPGGPPPTEGPIPTITITTPADGAVIDATPLRVAGTVAVAARVTVAGVEALLDGLTFSADVPVVAGENAIEVVATALDAFARTDRRVVTVQVVPPVPRLTITAPADGAVLDTTPVRIAGTVAVPASVTVAGIAADVMGLAFTADVPLILGENTIDLVATAADAFGATDSASLTVTYEPPIDPPPYELTVTLDASRAQDGTFELLADAAEPRVAFGTYAPVEWPVRIRAAGAGATFETESADGAFRLLLPRAGGTSWSITATELLGRLRSGAAELRFVADTVPPELEIDGGLERTVDRERTTIAGRATDALSGVERVLVFSDRFAGVAFEVIRGEAGGFYAELPLARSDNFVTVRAIDGAGNQAERVVRVERPSAIMPELQITSPAPGTRTEQPSLPVSGMLYTTLGPQQVRVRLGADIIYPTPAAQPGRYAFTFPAVALADGVNEISVHGETTAGDAHASVIVVRGPPEVAADLAPRIVVQSPAPGAAVSGTSLLVDGWVERGVGAVTLTIDGIAAPLIGPNRRFRHTLDISARAGAFTVALAAGDAAGGTDSMSLALVRDVSVPVITITTPGLLPPPAVTRVVDTPFALDGYVTDDGPVSLTINGEAVRLTPGEGGRWDFSARLALPIGVERRVVLEARDFGGSRATLERLLLADPPVLIEILSPAAGAAIGVGEDSPAVAIVARISGLAAGHSVEARLGSGAGAVLTLDAGMARGSLPPAGPDGAETVVVEVLDGTTVVARASAAFTLVDLDNLPLEVVRAEPPNGATGVEPETPLTLYFNKVVEPRRLSIELHETAHSLTYVDGPSGAAELTQVHRDQEPVPGGLSLLPGGRIVSFQAQRDFAYTGSVLATVRYDGADLLRTAFDVRGLPTLASGVVADQFMEPIAGIEVHLPGLGMLAVTDVNGAYGFGFGLSEARGLPAGRHLMVVNPGQRNRAFGTTQRWASFEAGRHTPLEPLRVPILNPDVPFVRLLGGSSFSLAGGDLELDLTGAELLFPDGRPAGEVHVQFMGVAQLGARPGSTARPHWAYGVQPAGVGVLGAARVSFTMPPLGGGYDYVPADGTPVAIIGYEPESRLLLPVGVGRVRAGRVESGPLELRDLSFLGYALLDAPAQHALAEYESGAIDLQRLLYKLDEQPAHAEGTP